MSGTKQKVFIAIPTKTGAIDVGATAGLVHTMCTLQAAKIPTKLRPIPGDSIIARVRNAVVNEFMGTDCTDLVFVDDDLTWETHAMQRLLSHDCDIVGGAYLKKQNEREWPVRLLPNRKPDLETGLLEVQLLPTGFMRIRRHVLEAMLEAHKHLRYRTTIDGGREEVHTALFWVSLGRSFGDGPDDLPGLWGEDFTFCERWRGMGGKVHLDTLLKFGHSGRHTWWGAYAEDFTLAHVFAKQEPAPQRFVAEAEIAVMPKLTVAEAAE